MSARASFGLACIAMLALGGCAATPAEEDPVQIKLNDLDTRLQRIERVMANQSLLDIANQLEALRSDVRGMHNDVDQLHNANDASRKQQRDMYADLDQRVKNLESRGAAAAAPPSGAASGGGGAATPAAPDGGSNGEDKAGYQAAFNLLKEGQYDRAIAAFQKFLAAYPDSSLADNGQYWLGEAYYVNKAYPEAQAAFQRVVDKYPQSRKLADALLKIGYCRYEMKQWESAREVLGQVVARFTDTPAARLAQQRLDKMSAEKH
ncbi:MAG TPA: tol-pal system protein YbgF [Steroidobacteraceae bacterium]|nr:tol-pal system protein YbgF [Steroidobacteraceae bacterium]